PCRPYAGNGYKGYTGAPGETAESKLHVKAAGGGPTGGLSAATADKTSTVADFNGERLPGGTILRQCAPPGSAGGLVRQQFCQPRSSGSTFGLYHVASGSSQS